MGLGGGRRRIVRRPRGHAPEGPRAVLGEGLGERRVEEPAPAPARLGREPVAHDVHPGRDELLPDARRRHPAPPLAELDEPGRERARPPRAREREAGAPGGERLHAAAVLVRAPPRLLERRGRHEVRVDVERRPGTGGYFIHPFSRYARSAPGWSGRPTFSGVQAVFGSNSVRPAWRGPGGGAFLFLRPPSP